VIVGLLSDLASREIPDRCRVRGYVRLETGLTPAFHNGLDGEAHGYVSRAVENLKNLVADQTTEFAPGPLFGNGFDPAVAGVAVGAGDVGLLHLPNMHLRLDRSNPVPLSVSLALGLAPNCDDPAGPSGRLSDK
jgi:hypothetical protein